MAVRKPYYGIHQIITGQYTAGNEYVLADGTDYIGVYHILPNGQRVTDARPNPDSDELFIKRNDVSDSVKQYNRINDIRTSQYSSPIPIQPQPSGRDYEIGEIERFFVQKRNNPYVTIAEIDAAQYNTTNTRNSPGINGGIWNKLMILWKISQVPIETASELNRRQVAQAERDFPGIGRYLTNPVELYK